MKLKDLPKDSRPRERFLAKGPEALSKSELLAIVLGSGIQGKNVQELAKQIIQKSGKDFLSITVDDLRKFAGIGQAKALQIVASVAFVMSTRSRAIRLLYHFQVRKKILFNYKTEDTSVTSTNWRIGFFLF